MPGDRGLMYPKNENADSEGDVEKQTFLLKQKYSSLMREGT